MPMPTELANLSLINKWESVGQILVEVSYKNAGLVAYQITLVVSMDTCCALLVMNLYQILNFRCSMSEFQT